MAELDRIYRRIEDKKADYGKYAFTEAENNAFKTFFDLAQEFEDLDDLYALCVAIPRSFFNLHCRLYAFHQVGGRLALVAGTDLKPAELFGTPPAYLSARDRAEGPYYAGGERLVLSIRGKSAHMEDLPFKGEDGELGILEVYPVGKLGEHKELFFEKYANRIGFNIHNRYLLEKNVEHLRFIRSLVADIEHNVIVPNMYYKLFLRDLKAQIGKAAEAERALADLTEAGAGKDGDASQEVLEHLRDANKGLKEQFENIERHYRNMSLFLEALLRRSHFDEGRLILRTKSCDMERDVVRPQLELYAEQFAAAKVEVNRTGSGLEGEGIISVVDVGLMAQVWANLFSNAAKYTGEHVTPEGERMKFVSYGHVLMKDCFGPGKDGIKYNVFTTGPHLTEAERKRVFQEGFRGGKPGKIPGTGHGLYFVKNVVEIHGGRVGYEPTDYGNNFYFILPK